MSRQTNNINSESIKSINEKIKNNPRANNGLLAATLSALLAQDFQSHNPQESPTYDNAPPVEQSNPDSVRHTWQYNDPRRTADNAPPVGQTKNLNLDANTLTAVLKLLQRQNEF